MPPSFKGGLLCANAAVAATSSTEARTPERTRFIESLPVDMPHCFAAFVSVAAIMPQAVRSGKLRAGRGSHAGLLDRAGFPQGGMIDGALEFAPVLTPAVPFPEHG